MHSYQSRWEELFTNQQGQIMTNFKPEQWVINKYTNEILQFFEVDEFAPTECYGKHDQYIGSLSKLSIWQPKPGEWCWFWRVSDFDAPILSRFYNMKDNLFTCTNSKQSLFTHCEPFIGQLPTTIKDNT